jgi:hypothetical protein
MATSNLWCEEKEEDENGHILTDLTPEIVESSADVDNIIARKMSKLSMEDREKIYQDVHGVSAGIEETPSFIDDCKHKLEFEIQKLKNKKDYDIARKLNPEYVQDPDFLIKFLRADHFEVKKSEVRLARYFKAKMELFGEDKIVRDIVQDDLNAEDLAVLHYGSPHILPLRDRSGRVVSVWIPRPKIQALPCFAKVRLCIV